jgi:hypothetical protein
VGEQRTQQVRTRLGEVLVLEAGRVDTRVRRHRVDLLGLERDSEPWITRWPPLYVVATPYAVAGSYTTLLDATSNYVLTVEVRAVGNRPTTLRKPQCRFALTFRPNGG